MTTSNNSHNLNQQTLADTRANERPPVPEKGNYIPWESRFRRFLDNKLEDGERMWNSIQNGPYQRPMIADPNNPIDQILKPLSRMTDGSKKGLQGDSQEDKLTTAMILLARAISQKFSSPTNNHLSILPNTRNQAVVQDGQEMQVMKAIKLFSVFQELILLQANQMFCNEKGHYARECQKPKVCDAKYFREQMLLAMKDEAENNLNNEENDFMLDNEYGEETLDELTTSVTLMARIQLADGNAEYDIIISYDTMVVSQVNVSSKANGQVSYVKSKTIIHTSDVS
nr:hypothetical protein [Tanacetum cinerariifolium]